MLAYQIKLNSAEEARKLHEIVLRHTSQADLRQGDSCVDARSLLGILSLDFSLPMTLEVYEGCRKMEEHLKTILSETK